MSISLHGGSGFNRSSAPPVGSTFKSQLAGLSSEGSLGQQLEYQSARFFEEVISPEMIVGMAVGTSVFTSGRSLILPRLMKSSSPVLSKVPWVTRITATGLATVPEVGAFWLSSKGITELRFPGMQSWDASTNLRELASFGMTLGFLKTSGFAFGRLGAWAHGTPVAAGTPIFWQQAGMLVGIMGGHGAEIGLGWGEYHGFSSFLTNSLVTLVHFNAGGALSQAAFPRLYALNHRQSQRMLRQEQVQLERIRKSQWIQGAKERVASEISHWQEGPWVPAWQGAGIKASPPVKPLDMLKDFSTLQMSRFDEGGNPNPGASGPSFGRFSGSTGPGDRLKLLVGGDRSFPQIIENLRMAQQYAFLKMYLWRADATGLQLGHEALRAADRGVEVVIEKDRHSAIFEHAETVRQSLFNPRLNFGERVRAWGISFTLKDQAPPDLSRLREATELFETLQNHPRVRLDVDTVRSDHSKFLDFDGRVLVSGDTNFGHEYRSWHTYMVEMADPALVARFYARRQGQMIFNPETPVEFAFNVPGRFEIKDKMIRQINEAERELTLEMSYFGDRDIHAAMVQAAGRVGAYNVILPEQANVQDSLNKKMMHDLWAATNGGVNIYLYPGMVHAKLIKNEHRTGLGSANANPTTERLGETNLYIRSSEADFTRALDQQLAADMARSTLVTSPDQLQFDSWRPAVEYFFVKNQKKAE